MSAEDQLISAYEMRRAVLLWAERFQLGDRWDSEDRRDLESVLAVEANPTSLPRCTHRAVDDDAMLAADLDTVRAERDQLQGHVDQMQQDLDERVEKSEAEAKRLLGEWSADQDHINELIDARDALDADLERAEAERDAVRHQLDQIREHIEAPGAASYIERTTILAILDAAPADDTGGEEARTA